MEREKRRDEMNRKMAFKVTALAIAIILLAISGYLLLMPATPREDCMKVSRFDLSYIMSDANLGKRYCINDEVVSSETTTTPEITYDPTNDTYIVWNSTRTYSVILFNSTNLPLYFLGNRTQEFQEGADVTFYLEDKRYEHFGFEKVMVEPEYVLSVLLRGYYQGAIGHGLYRPIETEANSTATLLKLNITAVHDSYPLPLNWSDIQLLYRSGYIGVTPNFQVRIEDQMGSLLGTLQVLSGHSENPNLNLPVSAGQVLVIPLDTGIVFDRIDVESDTWLLNRIHV
jgi:hypothetical protein